MNENISGSEFVTKAKDVFTDPMTPLESMTVDSVQKILEAGINVPVLVEGELGFKPSALRNKILSVLGYKSERSGRAGEGGFNLFTQMFSPDEWPRT